ncbi:MAG: hypothetical protein B7Z66_04695 [Chromatiales bacterium 21-64-14]|nr:MAG: hypothetical protein B7Z66_04695 [Chromatiales bacterium 21-64-14]HQU14628.1 thiol:disulfide interchange protein DsbA/DsbL [Gammaproteobacteria bacterium]
MKLFRNKLRFRWVLWAALVLVPGFAQAGPAKPQFDAGIDYKVIDPPVAIPGAAKGKVTVVEFFWYGCPHCYHFEPYLDAWLEHKPADVQFIRIPAPLNPTWTIHARAYYAAQELGVLNRIHRPLFDAVQKEGPQLASEDALTAFFAQHGVKAADFRAAYESFTVDAEVRRARALAQSMGISGVPTLVVDGKFKTDASLAGGNEKILQVVDYLVRRESRQAAVDRTRIASTVRLKSAPSPAANSQARGAHAR